METKIIIGSEKLECGHHESPHAEFTRGWATKPDGSRICYNCAAEEDKDYMRKNGRITLYLVKRDDGYHVTNWPGTLDIKATRPRVGRHNLAGVRYDFWFWFEGHEWHGVQYGDNTQLCHCTRSKTAKIL